VWWYRHPGHKRLDFSPGDEIPARRKNGQPKTLAEALVLLEAERARAAELEDAAKRAQTQEGVLRNELRALRDELAEERKKHAETNLQRRTAENKVAALEEQYESLSDELRTGRNVPRNSRRKSRVSSGRPRKFVTIWSRRSSSFVENWMNRGHRKSVFPLNRRS
jgi:hypothetical protein